MFYMKYQWNTNNRFSSRIDNVYLVSENFYCTLLTMEDLCLYEMQSGWWTCSKYTAYIYGIIIMKSSHIINVYLSKNKVKLKKIQLGLILLFLLISIALWYFLQEVLFVFTTSVCEVMLVGLCIYESVCLSVCPTACLAFYLSIHP
jgi:hypothetical protein